MDALRWGLIGDTVVGFTKDVNGASVAGVTRTRLTSTIAPLSNLSYAVLSDSLSFIFFFETFLTIFTLGLGFVIFDPTKEGLGMPALSAAKEDVVDGLNIVRS